MEKNLEAIRQLPGHQIKSIG